MPNPFFAGWRTELLNAIQTRFGATWIENIATILINWWHALCQNDSQPFDSIKQCHFGMLFSLAIHFLDSTMALAEKMV